MVSGRGIPTHDAGLRTIAEVHVTGNIWHTCGREEKANEPPYDKTNKMNVRPSKTQISLDIRPIGSVFVVRMKKG